MLLIAAATSCLIMLDTNIVAVSLPSIARSFHASFADIEWVISAYILAFAALLLAAGAVADLHGRKRATLLGLGVFMLGSLGCGLAGNAIVLNAARVIQGIGASLILTASLAVINHEFQGAERARAYAFWGICNGIAIATGPIIGGVITSLFGWRWAFLVNLPVCAGLFIMAARVFPESRDPDATRFDWLGVISFSLALLLLTWALIEGNTTGWASAPILARLAGAAVLLAAFVAVESVQTRPMMEMSLLRSRNFIGAAAAMAGYAAGAQVMIFYLPLYLQTSFAFSPLAAGLAMMPFAVPMFMAPRLAARLARRHTGRSVLGMGLAVTCAGGALLAALAACGVGYGVFVVGMVVAGTGAGLLNGETTKVLQGTVPPARAGLASGLGATTRFVALLMGVAGLGAILADRTAVAFTAATQGLPLDPALTLTIGRHIAAGDLTTMMNTIPLAERAAVTRAALTSFHGGFCTAAMAASLIALVTGILAVLLIDAGEPARLPAAAMPINPATD